MNQKNFKWQKIIWSLVVTASIYLYFTLLIERSSSKLGAYPYMVLGWWVAIFTAVLIFILRLIKINKVRGSFFYILVGSFNLLIGVVDVYAMASGSMIGFKWALILLIPLSLSI